MLLGSGTVSHLTEMRLRKHWHARRDYAEDRQGCAQS